MRVCLFREEHISIWDDDIPTHCIYSQRHAWIGEMHGISNHWRLYCLPNRLFRHRSKKTSKLRVTGLCAGNSSVAGEFPAQRTSNAEMFPFDDIIMGSHCFSNTCETMIIMKKYPNEIKIDLGHYAYIFLYHAICVGILFPFDGQELTILYNCDRLLLRHLIFHMLSTMSSFGQTTKKKLCITDPLWQESTNGRWIISC